MDLRGKVIRRRPSSVMCPSGQARAGNAALTAKPTPTPPHNRTGGPAMYPVDSLTPREQLAFWSTLKEMTALGACAASAQPRTYQAFKLVEQEAEAKQRYWLRVVSRSPSPPLRDTDGAA